MTTLAKFDTAKFRKVWALVDGGATEGERASARVQADRIAKSSGMTLEQALSKLDAKSSAPPRGFFDGFDDWMEGREPGWKAENDRKRADRANRDAQRRAEVLALYGSEAGLFARTELETLLDIAIAPIATWGSWTDDDGREYRFAVTLDGKHSSFWSLRDITPRIRDAVMITVPPPHDLGAALEEVKAWDRLRWDRGLFCGGEFNHYIEVECRISLLEHALNAGQPAKSWDDVQARFDWKRYEFERQWLDRTERDDPFLDRIEADIAILRGMSGEAGPRTNADKRRDVLSMLDTHPDLSDREIARRTGVSPQTVNNWRRRKSS